MSEFKPWPHQEKTLAFLADRPFANDFSDPGTGKTMGQIVNYAQRTSPGRMLVVCPKTLMRSAWGADFEKFAPSVTFSLAYADNRQAAFEMPSDVVITNTDAVRWLIDNPKILKGFDHCVVDESPNFKNPTSQRSKALKAMHKAFKRRNTMTGTPTPISVTELWNPMMFVDGGKRLGSSFFHFRSRVQIPHQIGPMANMVEWSDRPGAAEAVDQLLADITIRHPFEEVMTHIPKNTPPETKRFKLSKRAQAIYTKFENECFIALKDSDVTAVHAAALRMKLLQIASGAVYSSEDKYEVIDRQRYELITELVEGRQHSIVFFNWRHQRDELAREFTAAKITYAVIDGSVKDRGRDQIVYDYQQGKYQTLLLHPRTGAHGLTLTRGTTTIIASPFYEADLMKQAIARIYRGGQTQKTNTLLVEAEGTVDEIVNAKRDAKLVRMNDLLQLIEMRNAA